MTFKHLLFTCLSVSAVALSNPVHAESKTVQVKFQPGSDHTTIKGTVNGYNDVLYKLNARNGQFLSVSMKTDNESSDFNIYIPGRGPGDEALYASAMGDRKYLGQLYKDGDHTISVFLNRAAARRDEKANFEITFRITDKAPAAEEEVPAVGPVPQKVIDDCLIELRKGVGHEAGLKVIKAERGENSFIIDVQVQGAEKPWRCFHDGTKCTGTEYQGEG